MKIYITDLEAYNNGHLVGAWYTLPMSEEELAKAVVNELQKGEELCNTHNSHEEYFITDYECDYMKIEQYDSIYKLNDIAQQIEALTQKEVSAVKIMLDNYIVNDIKDAIENIDNMICTNELKMEDIAYNYLQESGVMKNLSESLHRYFDYEAFGRDMQMDGNYYMDDEEIIWEYVG